MMAGPDCRVMIVGDDDQSIYGWRGAKIENIQKFLMNSPVFNGFDSNKITVQPKTILQASNELISNNTERMGSEWTDGERWRANLCLLGLYLS